MRRRFPDSVAVLFFLTGLAVVALQSRACWTWDSLEWSRGWVDPAGYHSWGFGARSMAGGISLGFGSFNDGRVRPGDERRWGGDCGYYIGSGWLRRSWDASAYSSSRSTSGWKFRWRRARDDVDVDIGVPYWFAATATIVPSIGWFWLKRRRRRRDANRPVCVNCGYDLRASPQRCPECGVVPAAGCRAVFAPRLGNCMIMLGECPNDMHPSQLGCHNYFAYLRVDDADAYHAQLQRSGVQALSAVEDKPWGMREFGVTTPDGHRIRIGQPAAG